MVTDDRHGGNLTLSLTFPQTQQQIRVVGTLEQPEWVAKDVCDVLGIEDVNGQLKRFDEDEKGTAICPTPGGPQEMLTVTEPGLYRLVLKSRKPAAKEFKRWICHEVLPSIRRQGCYVPVQGNPNAIMLRQLADSLERQDTMEAQQQDMAKRLDCVAGKVRDMDGDTGYVTVLAYARAKGMDMPRSEAQRHGKALTKIHKAQKITIGRVPDERHGKVNAYRIDVVEEYFAGMESRP